MLNYRKNTNLNKFSSANLGIPKWSNFVISVVIATEKTVIAIMATGFHRHDGAIS